MASLNSFNPVGAFQGARSNALGIQAQEQGIARETAAAPTRNALADLSLQQAQVGAERGDTQFDQGQALQRAQILNQSARAMKGLDVSQRKSAFQKLAPKLQEFGIDTNQFANSEFTDADLDSAIAETQGFLADPQSMTKLGLQKRTLDIREQEISQRRDLKELEPELAGQKETKKLEAQLGLKPTLEGKIEKAKGDVKASTDIISKSFEKIGSITTNIRNIDRAISAINRGAKTGVIAKLVPSITAASRELRQIQNELGLDVIGSVTFGALSQGELDLALETAIDLGLEPEALKDVLTRKKEAQNKLIDYLDEQMQFLDDGGTLAGWRDKVQQGSLPEGVTEDDIATTMQIHNLSRDAVMQRLGGQ
tara:strand:- start:2888 stop:3988 length:1101 start_codon:yes stop_codon:yes gene_type:complete